MWPGQGLALAADCAPEQSEGSDFIVGIIDPAREDLRLFWRNGDGEPYRYSSALADAVGADGQTLVLEINGGMYGEGFAPIGLMSRTGPESWTPRPLLRRAVRFATQSGPLLV